MTKSEFEALLNDKDALLDKLKLLADVSTLTMDLDETDFIENWFVNSEHRDQKLVDTLTVYYGESFIKHLGGHWEYCADPKQVDYESPVIIDYTNFSGIPLSPLGLVRAGMKKGKTGMIRSTIEFLLNKDAIMKGIWDESDK